MANLADYSISAVRYESDGSPITKLKVHKIEKNKVGSAVIFTKDSVINKINNDFSFITNVWNKKNSNWDKGENVRVYESNGKKYLRTDSNGIASDNLSNLPIF